MPKKDETKKDEILEENNQDTAEVTPETQVDVEELAETESLEATSETPSTETEVNLDNFDTTSEDPTTEANNALDPDAPITVQPIQFGSFEDLGQTQGETNKNLDILMDIKLQLTVELGRTELPIKKVLELTRGSIIELEKVAGEPVELYANGKLIAHGEVVVIEDNFGLRITSITDSEARLKGLGN